MISKDEELTRVCRDILGASHQNRWELWLEEPLGPHSDADLHIWDFQPDQRLPENSIDWKQAKKHLFLVHRKDLGKFREEVLREAHILLKPVTRAALAAFVEQAGASAGDMVHSLRSERDDMLQCLIQANLKLQEYDQDRTNFLARAVHDFRAPLTALCGYCGLLLEEQLGPVNEEQREVLQRMQNSARRLSRMAQAMFQLSVGQRVEYRPDFQQGDIRECLKQALYEVMPAADKKGIAISVAFQTSPQPLFFEHEQIAQVLINLLDNACKFTPRFGSIEIRGYPYFWERRVGRMRGKGREIDRRSREWHKANAFRIDIRDSGPGVPIEHLERIFEEYTRYASGEDRSGGGLGLAICRMILNQHEGRVWAESGRAGTAFSFVLPFRLAETAAAVSCLAVGSAAQN